MDGAGWAVGADRTAVTPTPAAFSQPGTQTGTGPAGAVRHPVRAVHRDSVGVPAAGVGVRLRDDLLAPVGPVAPGRGLATPARAAAGRTQRRGQVGLVQGGDRRLACAGLERRPKTGPSPVDRAKTGSKHHVITEGAGIPLAVTLTGGNRHDVTQLLPLIQAIPSVRGKRGRPRRRPDSLYADRAYDYDIYRDQVSGKGITPHFARRGVEHGSGLGVHRWVVEQTVALLHWFRRLRIRWEIRDDIHEAFMSLACSIICYRRLVK